MTAPTFDLQSHSVHSDGALPAAEVVRLAAEAGVELFALSDHDTVDGVPEAMEEAARRGIRLVATAELSAVHGGHEDLHILGYRLDVDDGALAERLADARADRVRRADRMGDRLRELGFAIDDAPLQARRAAGKPIGRPHLAAAVLQHPDNAERLAAEGHDDVSSFIPAYLIPGTPGYLARTYPTVEEAIGWIHDAGGLAVWAHPFWDLDDPQEALDTLASFADMGLDGVEAFYVTHNAEQTRLLYDAAVARDLITTGSSDFHGPEHRLFRDFRAFELHGLEPRLGPLADMTS